MTSLITRRALAAAGALPMAFWATAQSAWPERPVRLVVPFAAGGSTDLIGRLVGQRLGERLGQQVVVENKPGGATNIAAEFVVKSRPDGYTLLFGAAAMSVNPALLPGMPYDLLRDLAPVTLVARTPLVLVVHPALPMRTVQELLAWVRAQPGGATYATGGNGTIPHMASEMLRFEANLNLTHVPYRGQAMATPDVVAGRIPMMLESVPPLLPLIRNGEVRAIAVAEPQRLAVLPDVPTLAESGFPGFQAAAWNAIWAPSGTPPAIIARVNHEVAAILEEPATRQRFAELGALPSAGTPAELERFVRAEMARWAEVIRRAGIRPG